MLTLEAHWNVNLTMDNISKWKSETIVKLKTVEWDIKSEVQEATQNCVHNDDYESKETEKTDKKKDWRKYAERIGRELQMKSQT